jgi:DeoR family transcriptional regulator, fructose operon transcriptional repressor
MSTDERRALILEILRTQKSVSVSEIAQRTFVSESTIRRDLADMESLGVLRRTHGGAEALPEIVSLPSTVATRTLENDRIGQLIANWVKPGQNLLIDAGPISERIAYHLRSEPGPLTVFTNSVPVAVTLAPTPHIVTLLTGGKISHPSLSLTGYPAERTLQDIAVDVAILCPEGMDIRRGLFTSDLLSVSVRQAMVRVAKRMMVAVEHTRISTPALAYFASISDINLLATGSELPKEIAAELKTRGIELLLA